MTAIRFRRPARSTRWRNGQLRTVGRSDGKRLVAEVVDDRTGGTRTLDTDRCELEVLDGGRWLPLDDWADTTAPLFTTDPRRSPDDDTHCPRTRRPR
jgi:hypothetical protein